MAAAEAPAPDTSSLAVIVLIGEAGRSPALGGVIEELLKRQNVQPRVEPAERFEPNDWLDRSPTDARTFVFVTVPTQQRAQLSSAMAKSLRASGLFEQVQNGETADWTEAGSWLLAHRYQLAREPCQPGGGVAL